MSERLRWRSLQKVGALALAPGDQVLFRRGGAWTGPLRIAPSGTATAPIRLAAYGSGALPLLSGTVTLAGNWLILEEVHVDNGSWAGVDVTGSHNTIRGCSVSHNVAGVFVRPTAVGTRVVYNDLADNDRMSVNTPGGDDDSGAFGVRNNVIQAVLKAGYADAAFDEDYDLFSGPTQFPRGSHTLVGDPRFVDGPNGELRLEATSPAVDTASTPAGPFDLAGVPVPQDGNGDGDGVALPDRGAYERR